MASVEAEKDTQPTATAGAAGAGATPEDDNNKEKKDGEGGNETKDENASLIKELQDGINGQYDVIILGLGLKETILAGLFAQMNKWTVLNIDRSKNYGGEGASLNMDEMYKKFKPGQKPPKEYGRSVEWNIDQCPKFLMAGGNLVKVLLHLKVNKYLDFRSVMGSFVAKDGKLHKVPATAGEALSSDLMGFFEKRRFKNFLSWVQSYNEKDPKTTEGIIASKTSTMDVFKAKSLSDTMIEFTGHAIALHPDDSYLKKAATETIENCRLYANSLARHGNSPFIYPAYGLGGLPEGFARLCAVHGGLQVTGFDIDEILYDAQTGKVSGIKILGKTVKTNLLLGDPSWFKKTDLVKKVGNTARAICILDHPVPNTNNADSAQVIIPAAQCGRRHDIYCAVVNHQLNVAARGFWVAVLSTVQEAKNESDSDSDLAPAYKLLGSIKEKFSWVTERYVPTQDGTKNNVFITSSFDPSTHFEELTKEVLSLYPRMTGKELDLTIKGDITSQDATED